MEGLEPEVLDGARRTVARDRPWLTFEAHTNATAKSLSDAELIAAVGLAHRLGKALHHARYAVYVVDEVCGGSGCRNLLCVPMPHEARFEASGVWQFMSEVGLLTRCDGSTLWDCLQGSARRMRLARKPPPTPQKSAY